MDKKQMYVQVINLNTGKMFSLPTLYTDRTEACVCGQNYIRDRQTENLSELLFFRVLDVRSDGSVAPSYELWEDEEDEDEGDEPCPHPEQECCEDCPFYSECWEENEENEEDEEEDAEEPSSDSLAEILSVFNAIRPNY